MTKNTRITRRPRKALTALIATIYVANPVLVTAQVIVNANTPNDDRRAYVDQTQNGITKINIAKPNGAGVSHNSYQQFDIPRAGVVLNNGSTNANTRLAGWVEGNPNLLQGQEAKLILNEVVGTKASVLQGFLEVAGKKADVIVANEQGVTCNGCGFINTERATITTGRAVFNNDGSIGRLKVEQGQIHIGSEGVQASDSRLDVLTRFTNVQGPIRASEIRVVTGTNDISYSNKDVIHLQNASQEALRGLDVGLLGGMYANQITLMATGQGVGVRLDGRLLGAGQVSIQSDGTIRHQGDMQGDEGIRIESREVDNSGRIQSQRTIAVQTNQLSNSGMLQAAQTVQLQGEKIFQTGAIRAHQISLNVTDKLDNSGTVTAGLGGLEVQASDALENRTTGLMQSEAKIQLQTARIHNTGDIMAASDLQLEAQSLQNNQRIQAHGQFTGTIERVQNSAKLLASVLNISTQTLNNSGNIEGNDLRLQAHGTSSALSNSGLIAADNIKIQGHSQLSNTGKISTAINGSSTNSGQKNLSIQTSHQLNNNGGQLMSNHQLTLQTAQLDNRGGTISTHDGNLNIETESVDNRSGLVLQQGNLGQLIIKASGAILNSSGEIEGQGKTLAIEAAEINNNSGQILNTATGLEGQAEPIMNLTVTQSAQGSGQLQNILGTISATGPLQINAQALITDASDTRLTPTSTLQFLDKETAQSGTAPNGSAYDWQADIQANEKVEAAKAEVDQAADQVAAAQEEVNQADANLSAAQAQKANTTTALREAQTGLANAQTQTATAQAAALAEPLNAALVQSARDAQIQADTAQAAVNSAQTADQQAQTTLTQAQATAQVAQAAKVAADQNHNAAQAAYLTAQSEVKTISDSTHGSSTSAADTAKPSELLLSAPSTPTPFTSSASIQSGRKLTLSIGDGDIDNRQGRFQAQDIEIQTSGNLWAGQIQADNSISLKAQTIEAAQRIQAKNTGVYAEKIHNTGRIEGTQELRVESSRLDNSGTLQSANTHLQAAGTNSSTDFVLHNTGLIQGYVNLNIDTSKILNNGTVSAGQAHVRGTQKLENRGVIFSTGNLTLQGLDIVNNQARIHSMGDLTLEGLQVNQSSGTTLNYAGRLEAQGDVTIRTNTLTNRAVLPSVNQRGYVQHIKNGGNIITRATDTFNADGKKAEIIAGKKLNIDAKTVNNDYGLLSAWHEVNVNTDTLNNTAYGAIQTENMVAKAACYNCHQTVRYADSWGGFIESGGAAKLRALIINNKSTDTRDGFAGLSSDPRVVIVDERSGTQSPLTKAFVERFGVVNAPTINSDDTRPVVLPNPRALSDNLVLSTYGDLDFSRFVLPNGQTGFFELADSASPYLIQGRTDLIPRETGAQHTTYQHFLGSDYLMTRLGLIPVGAKRLGDAWYETQLVQEQLFALSGRRYLITGTSNDYDLMRDLMDAGLLAQARLQLVAGNPLSQEQLQALTQDIVWPEWQTINGQRVLVPKVYLAQKQSKPNNNEETQTRQNGALIAAHTIDIQTTELNQSNAHITAENALTVSAKGAVLGSGSYSGGTSVAVVAGNIVLTNASLVSEGSLKLQSTQGDLNLTATQITAGGEATLQSAGALNLTAQKHEAQLLRSDGSQKNEVKYETTNVTAGNNASLSSQQDLTVQGSAIIAGQNLTVQSTTGRVTLQAVSNTEDVTVKETTRSTELVAQERDSQEGSWPQTLVSQTTTGQKTIRSRMQDSVGVKLQSGGNTKVQSAQDLILQGTQIQAGQNIQIQSDQGSVQLQAISDFQNSEEKKESRTAGGGFGRLVRGSLAPKATQTSQSTSSEQNQQGVTLRSTASTQIQAAKDISAQSMQVQAGQTTQLQAAGVLHLQGGNLDAKGQLSLTAASASVINNQLQSGGTLDVKTTQGDLTLTASSVKAASDVTLSSAGALQMLATKQTTTVGSTSHTPSKVQAGGSAKLTSQRDLTAQGGTITAGKDLLVQSTDGAVDLQAVTNSIDTNSTSTSGRSFFARIRTSTTNTHTEAVQGPQLQAGGNAQVLAAQNLSAQSLQLQAGGNATLAAAGTLALTSDQAYSRTTTGSDVRQSLQTERTQIQAAGNTTLYGQQGVQIDAADVRAGGNARVNSQGSVVLGSNTDTEQRNWTTSSSSSTLYGKTKTTTTQHQTLDQEAERTRIQAGSDAVVLGQNVGSIGAQVSGKTLTQIEGADQTKLYDMQEVHQYSANSQTRKGFIGITYSRGTSQDSSLQSNALPTELKSDRAVRVGVGAVTDVRGAILDAPSVEFYRSANADTTKPGELILGTSTNTTQTSLTEKTTTSVGMGTIDVYQKQSGQGSTKENANQTQINGQLKIGSGIHVTVQVPEGALKDQIEALSQQPGQAYLAELASNPKVNWEQIKLVHDQWQYSQQGLTGAGAALLAIAVAYVTAGMGTALVGTTTAAAGGASTTAVAGTTLATTTTTGALSYTAAGAALNAGLSALASNAAVSLVNNRGDLGHTLKDLGSKDSVKNVLLSMATAGALNQLGNAQLMGNKTLNQITVADGFAPNLGKSLINNMASATMNSALTGAKLEDSLKTALTSAVISAGAGQAAFAIGEMTVPGVDGKPPVLNAAGQALAHALAGCMTGAMSTNNSQGCQSGAIGAVVGELAAQWYDPTGSKPQAEVLEFVKVVSATAGAMTGDASAASVNTAVMTGVNAAENNWLATRQKAQLVTELNAANNALDKAKVLSKYALISGKQDVLTVAGVGKGLAESGWTDIQGMAEFLSDPVKGLQGLQQVITDPQTRAALGDQLVNDFTAKIDRMNKALEVGGDANAVQLGQDLGSLVWQVGSVVTGVAGTAKAGAMLASAGVKVGAEVLENTALKLSAFNAGSIQGFKSAEAINAMMTAADGWSPAWKPGTAVAEMTMKPGTTVKMVVDGDTLEKIKAGETGRAFGGWATFDDVPNQAYAREKLAITSAMKPDVGYVVELKITRPINAQVGVVGAQGGASGGGNQLHFLVNAADRSNVFEFVQGSGKALQ